MNPKSAIAFYKRLYFHHSEREVEHTYRDARDVSAVRDLFITWIALIIIGAVLAAFLTL